MVCLRLGRSRQPVRLALFGALLLGAVGVDSAGAQSVRGTVVMPDGVTPASGVVALLLRASSDSIVARAVTATSGGYLLRAPTAGEYRLRLLRLGQQPETVGPFVLQGDESIERNVVLVNRPIALARFNVRGKDECRTRPDTGLLVAQLLGEARKALLASVATSLDGEGTSEYQLFIRVEDTRRRPTRPEVTRTVTRPSARPFTSLSPDSLARVGYVVTADDSVIYHGPDAEVLLSDAFAARHCFQVVEAGADRAGAIGVAFRPVAVPPGIVEIRGTIWMERETGTLQSVEFTYDPIPDADRRAGVGGEVDFLRTESGLWLVKRWNIRMPKVALKQEPGIAGPMPTPPRTVRVIEGIQRSGGDVLSVRVGSVSHYQRTAPTGVVASAVTATRGDPMPVITEHPVCGPVGARSDSGATAGTVTTDGAQGVAGATVVARWRDARLLNGATLVSYQDHERKATTVAGGDYVLCGLPLDHPITLFVERNGSRSTATSLRLTGDAPVATSNLFVAHAIAAVAEAPAADSTKAMLRLRVRGEDGTGVPDAEVTVHVQAITRTLRSDNAGVAYFVDLPPGVVEIGVRRVGSVAKTVRTPIEPGRNELSVQLAGSAVTLEAVRVIGGRDISARHAAVDARIRRGDANAVVTRRDIEQRGPISLSQMLRSVPGLRIADSLGAKVAISTRGLKLDNGPEGLVPVPCVMRVMVDGILSNAMADLDQMLPVDVYAVEIFHGAARMPQEYSGMRNINLCGLIAIWTR